MAYSVRASIRDVISHTATLGTIIVFTSFLPAYLGFKVEVCWAFLPPKTTLRRNFKSSSSIPVKQTPIPRGVISSSGPYLFVQTTWPVKRSGGWAGGSITRSMAAFNGVGELQSMKVPFSLIFRSEPFLDPSLVFMMTGQLTVALFGELVTGTIWGPSLGVFGIVIQELVGSSSTHCCFRWDLHKRCHGEKQSKCNNISIL